MKNKHGILEKFSSKDRMVFLFLINSKNLHHPKGTVFLINCFFARQGGYTTDLI